MVRGGGAQGGKNKAGSGVEQQQKRQHTSSIGKRTRKQCSKRDASAYMANAFQGFSISNKSLLLLPLKRKVKNEE